MLNRIEMSNYNVLTKEEEIKILQDINKGNNKAKDKLITHNIRLVANIAKKYVGLGLEYEDLVQEGNLGLMKAVEKFDLQKKVRFSTYATIWINQFMVRGLENKSRTIRVPAHMVRDSNKLKRITRQLVSEEKIPTVEELAKKANMSKRKVIEIQKAEKTVISYEVPIGEKRNLILKDIMIDEEYNSTFDLSENYNLRHELKDILDTLTPKEKKIIQLRFGLDSGGGMTLQKIGEELGIKRQGVEVIEKRVLKKLKIKCKIKELDSYIYS